MDDATLPQDSGTTMDEDRGALLREAGDAQPEEPGTPCAQPSASVSLMDGDETPAAQLRKAALAHAGRALDTIVEIMNSSKASTGDRLRAAITVIERAYGKQDGAGSEQGKPDMLEDIREELARLRTQETSGAWGCEAGTASPFGSEKEARKEGETP